MGEESARRKFDVLLFWSLDRLSLETGIPCGRAVWVPITTFVLRLICVWIMSSRTGMYFLRMAKPEGIEHRSGLSLPLLLRVERPYL